MKRLLKNIIWLSVISILIYASMMWLLCKVDLMGTRGIYYIASYVPRKGGQELHAFRDYKADSTYQVLVLGEPDTPTLKTRSPHWREFLKYDVNPRLDSLYYIARAITPPYRSRRFDARFFMGDASMIQGAVPRYLSA